MDTTEKPIEDFPVMPQRLLDLTITRLLLSCSLALAGCGGSTPPPDDASSHNADTGSDSSSDNGSSDSKPTEPDNDTKSFSHGAKKMDGDAVPDDYTLTQHDCVELGKQYVGVQRADQVAKLDAKLTEKQREQAMKSIDGVVSKMGEPWTNGCIESLAGKVVDRKSLNCAMESKTVKGFDECLNGPATPPQ
jgi:hypothetical protein